MKYFIITLFLFSTLIGKSQSSLLVNDKLPIDSLLENKDENLIISRVIEVEGLKKDELKNKIKNWGSTKFVNLKEVLVSETDDQLVMNYIDKSYYVKSGKYSVTVDWYIRLVIQFKDGKIKCSYFDDGNAFIPSSQYSASLSRGTYKLKTYFKEEDGVLNSTKMTTNGLLAIKESVMLNMKSLNDYVLKKEPTSKEW